jgi:hypothetical protein
MRRERRSRMAAKGKRGADSRAGGFKTGKKVLAADSDPGKRPPDQKPRLTDPDKEKKDGGATRSK